MPVEKKEQESIELPKIKTEMDLPKEVAKPVPKSNNKPKTTSKKSTNTKKTSTKKTNNYKKGNSTKKKTTNKNTSNKKKK